MKPLPIVLIACALYSTAEAADREFTEVVRAISDEFRTRPVHIPFFGLVNAFTAVVRPAGAKHIDLAVFDRLNGEDLPGSIRHAVGGSWKPFVQVWSRRKGREETVLVYARQHGRDWKLLVAAVEADEATVVQLDLDANALTRWLAEPEKSARHWDRD